MKRRARQDRFQHDRWLVSYADFITILFAFFVVLFATGQADKRKQVAMSGAIAKAFGQSSIQNEPRTLPSTRTRVGMQVTAPPVQTAEMAHAETRLRAVTWREIQAGVVEIRQTDGGLTISLRDAGFFDSGSAEIRPQALSVLDRIASALPVMRLRVEGHTDNVPIATTQFASNWELSSARASSIARLLLRYSNVHADLLSVAGYAEFHPVADNATVEGRAKNRRVDLVIEGVNF